MKRMLSLLTASVMTLGMVTVVSAADINVTVEGTPVAWADAKPFIDENERTLVPLRPIANALGLEVSWNDDTNTASFTDGETTAEFVVGSNEYHCFLNGLDIHVYVEMDTKPIISDSRIYAPARYLAECFQYEVSWDDATKSVALTKAVLDNFADDDTNHPALPAIPDGEKAAADPMNAAPGVTAVSYIAVKGMVEDPDIFEYEAIMDTLVDCNSHSLQWEDDYLIFEMQPSMQVEPGKYFVTWTFPGGWFEDGEDVIVSVPLIVQKSTVDTALAAAVDELSITTIFAEEGATAEEINAEAKDNFWLFDETPFTVEISGGTMAEGEFSDFYWRYTVTVTDTETGVSASGTAESLLEYSSVW